MYLPFRSGRCFLIAALWLVAVQVLPWYGGMAAANNPQPRPIALDEAAETSLDLSEIRYIWQEELGEWQKTLFVWNSDAEQEGGPPSMDEPLASDRPDFTEASSTVGRGVCQIEMGYTYFHDGDGVTRTQSHSYPEILVRLGVLEWIELRLGWNVGQEAVTTGGIRSTASGVEDLYLGIKLGLTPQQGILPEMALLPQMKVPLGSVFSAQHVLPGVNWLYGWEINDFLTTAGSTQANVSVDDGTGMSYVEFAQSWTVG